MVRKLIVHDLCDDCDFHELPAVPAVVEKVVTIDGGPPRRVLLCPRCAVTWQTFIDVYKERGQEVEPASFSGPSRKKPKAVKAAKPKELDQAPAEQEPAEEPDARLKDTRRVRCPLPHPSTQGGPLDVTYSSRGTHAKMLHQRHVWEIKWEDPQNILTAFCTEHDFCHNVGFTSKQGLKQHIVFLRNNPPPQAGSQEESDGQAEAL